MFVEAGAFVFRPRMPALQDYLRGNGFGKLRSEPMYVTNFGAYSFDENQRKLSRVSFALYHRLALEARDTRKPASLYAYEGLFTGIDGDRYLRFSSRIAPFFGGGGALYLTSLRLERRSLGTLSVNFNAHTGLELDIVKRRLYLRLEGAYKQNVPIKFRKKDSEGKVIDRLEVKEQVSGPLYGLTLGVIF